MRLGDPSPRQREGEKGDKPLFHQSEHGKISGRLWSENKERWKAALWELALLTASAHHTPRVLIGKTGT